MLGSPNFILHVVAELATNTNATKPQILVFYIVTNLGSKLGRMFNFDQGRGACYRIFFRNSGPHLRKSLFTKRVHTPTNQMYVSTPTTECGVPKIRKMAPALGVQKIED